MTLTKTFFFSGLEGGMCLFFGLILIFLASSHHNEVGSYGTVSKLFFYFINNGGEGVIHSVLMEKSILFSGFQG